MKKILSACLVTLSLLTGNAYAQESITVATNPTWAPMQLVDLEKNVIGYEIDIVKAVGKEAGLDVKVIATEWDGIFGLLDSKNADVIASCVTITDIRKKRYLFTDPVYSLQQALVAPNGTSIKAPADLDDKRIGVQIGTTAIQALKKIDADYEIVSYDDIGLAFEDMVNGGLDAVMCDDPVARYYASRKEGYSDKMALVFVTEGSEDIGMVVRQDNTELATRLNEGLKKIKENGVEAQIKEKWFGSAN